MSTVILSLAKDLDQIAEILRCAQDGNNFL